MPGRPRARSLVLLLLVARGAAAAPLSPGARRALDAVLACERPEGGWTYVCDPPGGPYGAVTWPLVRARRLAAPFELDTWDVVVLRSPGTPAAGLALLEAWRRAGDPRDLAAARRAGDLLLALQLASGGWFSEVPVRGARPTRWFRALARWATLDDDVTSGAVRLLLALFEATAETRYRDGAVRGLDLLVAAQLEGGAWPLTWRPAWRRRVLSSFEDLPSTNDAATAGPILALLDGARVLARPELLAAAARGGEWLARVRGAPPQAGWAQQYDRDGRPAPGRRFEPIALASWESRQMVEALLALAAATGDGRFCAPVADAVAWLVRSQVAPGCWARFYAPGTNLPLYVGEGGEAVSTPERARRPYRWTGDYGIPALLGRLGLEPSGAPPRLPGDAGACPGDERPEALERLGPRGRIARAAALLGGLDRPTGDACGAEVRRALGPGRAGG